MPVFLRLLRQHNYETCADNHKQLYKPTPIPKRSLQNRNVGEDGTFREQPQSSAVSEEPLVSTKISKEKLFLAQGRRPQKA